MSPQMLQGKKQLPLIHQLKLLQITKTDGQSDYCGYWDNPLTKRGMDVCIHHSSAMFTKVQAACRRKLNLFV